jgi:hypothetical protein
MCLCLVHLDALPFSRGIRKRNTPQYEVVIKPLTGIQKVDYVPVFLGSKRRRAVRSEALHLLSLLNVRNKVARDFLPLDALGPLGRLVTDLIVDDELGDIFADVLRHVGQTDGDSCFTNDLLHESDVLLVHSKALYEYLGSVGIHCHLFGCRLNKNISFKFFCPPFCPIPLLH